MHAYIFLVHHDCSYVAGCAVIRAENYKQAKMILENLTYRDTLRPGEVDPDDDYMDNAWVGESDSILDEYPEKLPKDLDHGTRWCFNAALDLKDPATAGLTAFAYHDG